MIDLLKCHHKIQILILIFSMCLFALDDAEVPNTFSAKTKARASQVNENFDSLEIAINRLIDSLDIYFTRWSQFKDSTIDTVNTSYAIIDSLEATVIKAFSLIGKLTAGAIEIEGSNFDINGGDVSALTVSGGLTWSAAQDMNNQALTNVDINSGNIGPFTLTGTLTGGAQTISGTAFDINGADISAATVSGGLTWSAAQDMNNQALTNVDINSGNIGPFTLTGTLTGGAQTISGTAFDINGADISAATVSGGLTWSAAQDMNNQALTNVNFDGGDISAATISGGLTWSAAQDFTGITMSGDIDVDGNNIIQVQKLTIDDDDEQTISSGDILITQMYHTIDTEGDAALDTLLTITPAGSPVEGLLLIISTESSARDVFIKCTDALSNIERSTDILLDDIRDMLFMIYVNAQWNVINFENNG